MKPDAAARFGLARLVAEDADLAAPGREKPAMMRSSVVLPAPLRPISARQAPGCGFQPNVAQRRIVAVKLPDALNRDRAHSCGLLAGPVGRAVQQHESQRQNAQRQRQNQIAPCCRAAA